MSYDAKPDLNDVILSTWQERDRLHVALYLRKGEDDQGDLIVEWWDADCAQMFEDGFLKRSSRPGSLSDRDDTLAQSVLDYAKERNLEVLSKFEKSLLDAVAIAEGKIVAIHDDLAKKHADDEDFDPVYAAPGHAITSTPFPAMSDHRLHDVSDYLMEYLGDKVERAPTP